MGDIIDFHDKKATRKADRSEHIVSLDVFLDVDTTAVWARVDNAGDLEMGPDWHRFIASQLRRLAWISDGMAAQDEGSQTAPIACVAIFQDSKISIIHNDDMIKTEGQIAWVLKQFEAACSEICATINETA